MQEFKPDDTISNRYKVIRKLGAGAMGSVYLCEDVVENHVKVACKILVSENLEDQDVWAKGEYEALTRLRHPNLAKVYNFGRIGDTKDYFIVSEFIKGIDLYSATEYLHYDELTDIVVQICRALEYIHAQGYVHFDIKPDNILVTRYKTVGVKEGSKVQYEDNDPSAASRNRSVFVKPNVKLIDFGLAEKITGSFNFAIKGTLNYLAPEILNGQTPDKRADLYSLGVTLYQVANRDLPFYQEAGNFLTGGPNTKRSDLFGIHMKKHPEFLRVLILKLLEESPDDRFQTAKEVIQFINKHSEYHFEVETAETRASYFYSPKLIGRRRELNLLKEYHERCFFPHRWRDRVAAEKAKGDAAPQEAKAEDVPALEADLPPAAPAPEPPEEPAAIEEPDLEAIQPAEETASAVEVPALLIISGEMGAGKSRLLEEFQHFLKLNDLSCFVGNCYEGNRKAYQPFVEILRQLVYAFGLDSEFYRRYRADILRLLPELKDKRDDAEETDPNTRPDKEKLYFIERMTQLLFEASGLLPFVLVINNLHWVDEASIGLLEHFLRRIVEMRGRGENITLLACASMRPEEVHIDQLQDFLDDWRKSGQCREVPVRRLKHAQIQELLCAMLGFADLPEGFVRKLAEKTGGNPLFIVETLKGLQEEGVIRNVGDGWVVKATSYDRVEIPQSMEDLLEKRLARIAPKKRELLDVLSVVDKPVNPKFLQRLKRFEEVPILTELRDLEQSGLVTKTFDGGKLHFQVTQPKVREILYARISADLRPKYHGEIGAAYIDLYRGKEDEILEELAYHYQRSDQAAKAIELATQAGDRLKAIYANERAYEFYMYVLEKVEGDPEQLQLCLDTREKLGDLCTTMGLYEVADRSYATLLEEETRKDLDSKRVIKIYLARGRVSEIQGDYEQALKCFKDARNYLAKFERHELIGERIRVFNSIGWVYVCMGKYEKAMAISLEALRVIDGGPERIEHAMVYNTIGSANFFKGNNREAIEYHRRSLQIRENLENIPEITTSLNNLGSAHLAGTEYGEAAELFHRALKTSEEIGDPYGKAMTLHNLARLYAQVGQADKSWEALDESLKLSKLYNMRYLNIQNYVVRGKALKDQGEYAKAEGNFFRVLTSVSKQGNRWGLATVLIHIAELHRLQGNLKEARNMLAEGKRHAEDLDIHSLRAQYALEGARLAREDGGEGNDAAMKLLSEAKEFAEKCDNPEIFGEVQYETGETLVRLRRLREAPQYYKNAEEKFREVLDGLPEEFREGYATRLKTRFRDWRTGSKLSREAAKEGLPTQENAGPAPGTRGAADARPMISAEDSLRRVNELMILLCSGGTLKDFLGRVLDEVLSVLRADSAFLLRVQGHSVSPEVARAPAGKAPGEPEDALCLELIDRVLSSRKPLILGDVADDPAAAKLLEGVKTPISGLVIASIPVGMGRDGVLYVLNPKLPRGGGEQFLWVVQPFLNLMPLAYSQLVQEKLTVS